MKLCKICGINPATVPDRTYENIGRPIKSVCQSCHALQLRGDMEKILELHKKRTKTTALVGEEK